MANILRSKVANGFYSTLNCNVAWRLLFHVCVIMQADWLTMHILRHPPFFDTTRAGPVLAANKIVHGIALIVTLLCLILVAVVIAVKLSSLK
jgi:hypothetical protein